MINSFPTSILLREGKKDSEAIVGLREGAIMTISATEPENRVRYEGIVNKEVEILQSVKGKNWIVAGYRSAMAIYSIN